MAIQQKYISVLQIFKLAILLVVLQSCATHRVQTGSNTPPVIKDDFDQSDNISHTFYFIGDAGYAPDNSAVLNLLEQRIRKADTSSTLLFLGDNIYPDGMPVKGSKFFESAQKNLETQLAITKNFKGRTIFMAGNHDWRNGVQGIKDQGRAVDSYLNTTAFAPQNACGITEIEINDQTALIVVDSQWFLEDWDDHPEINKSCDIITRDQFFDEFTNLITKNQNKTTLIAIHHPLISNGEHGGEYSFAKHIFPLDNKIPLPIIGTVMNVVRRTSGVFIEDIQNKKYNAMVQRLKALVANKANILIVSGHDHSLQYLERDGVKQIISGAGSKKAAARAINQNDFSYGAQGYSSVKIHKNGAAQLEHFGIQNGKEELLLRQQPIFERPEPDLQIYPDNFATHKDTTIYNEAMTTRGAAYRFLWGNHYRSYYNIPIKARQVKLDSLYGGLTPTISAGRDEARFLRLQHPSGREFEMHALRKSATQLLQSAVFNDQSVERDFRNTYTEEFILDFYTTAYPFAPFVVSELARNIGLNHTNPQLFFIPKQNALAAYNEEFGDELYLVEERPTNESAARPRFGKPNKIVTTEEVLAALRSPNVSVDRDEYIKARLFDMLIGDWDRDADQWSWGEYSEEGAISYRPIPRGRDQAFSKFDGALLFVAMNFPAIRHMKTFKENLKNVRWFNRQAYNLDLAFLNDASEEDWIAQAELIQKGLTDAEIERAFKKLPPEVQDETAETLISQIKQRRQDLPRYAQKYFEILQEKVLITGTNSSDRFEIVRDHKQTKITVHSLGQPARELIYTKKNSKEIWLYGLGGEDSFTVSGRGRGKVLVRLMGGADNDTYSVATGRKVRIYDFKSQPNDYAQARAAKRVISDSYTLNSYDYEKPAYNIFGSLPSVGFNPDDGIKIGAAINYTVNGFNRAPYTQRHTFNANYFFATNGYELKYKGIFPRLVGNWDLIADLLYTSPNFSINFFGYGNETPNNDADIGLDYNRVKMGTINVAPSLRRVGESGSSVIGRLMFERNRVDETGGRFITETGQINNDVFDYKNFIDLNVGYAFENYDIVSNPTLGMTFSINGGYKINVDEDNRSFPYAESSLGFTYRLTPGAKWVLATFLRGRVLFDNDYEFYHAATLGGDTDLRGFRWQRFSGQQSFLQSTDIRWNIGKLKNGLAPVRYGIFGGFDYGRVWLENDYSDKWHQSAGGGVWFNGVNVVTAKLALFFSSDGPRLSFGFGFNF